MDRDSLRIVGQRHRYFWFAAKQVITVELQQIYNVVAAGRLVKFEVKLASPEGERIEIIRLRTSDAPAAQEIALALPTMRSAEFERVHHEKLSFDRSMEQLGTQPIGSDENHAWATNNLGLLYREGLGSPQNKDKAYGYFQKAAGQHNPGAYLNLADAAFSRTEKDDVETKEVT
jgi:hypothetical protein